MNLIDSIFEGLFGYEKLMLLCGFILFVFTLVMIGMLVVQRRKFLPATALLVVAIVMMGFPGIQSVKFSQDMVELNRIRNRPQPPADPAQKQQAEQALADLEKRAAGNPQLKAKVADGYRAIGEVDKAYRLAQQVLEQKPSAQVQATLVPVLTAKLEQVQANAPIAPQDARADTASEVSPVPAATVAAPVAVRPVSPVLSAGKQREIAAIASQLQATAAPLPADAHAALAKAYVVLGQPQKARANIDAARRINPNIKINTAVLRAARNTRPTPSRPPEH